MPATFVVKTGRAEKDGISGLQYYYRGSASTHSLRADGRRVIKSNEPGFISKEDQATNKPIGERRGRRAYVLGFGCIHPDTGNRYEIIFDLPLATSPEQDENKPVVAGPAICNIQIQAAADMIENSLTQADIEFEDCYLGAGGEWKWRIACPWESEHTGGKRFDSSSTIILWSDGKIIYSCKHAHCDGVRKWNEPDAVRDANTYLRHFIENKIGHALVFGEVFVGAPAPVPSPVDKHSEVSQSASAAPDKQNEVSEDSEDIEEKLPDFPSLTGPLSDLSIALYPNIPYEFKVMAAVTHWGADAERAGHARKRASSATTFLYTCFASKRTGLGKDCRNQRDQNVYAEINDTVRRLR